MIQRVLEKLLKLRKKPKRRSLKSPRRKSLKRKSPKGKSLKRKSPKRESLIGERMTFSQKRNEQL